MRHDHGDTDLSTLDDRRLTLLRRDRGGFVFQAFSLVPTLTRRREHPGRPANLRRIRPPVRHP